MRCAQPLALRGPLRPHRDLTIGVMAAEAVAGPSLQGVEPPGERGGLTVARLTAAADVPGAFHRCPAAAGCKRCHQSHFPQHPQSIHAPRVWVRGASLCQGCRMPVGTCPDMPHPSAVATHVFLALLKEQALFSGSGAWSAGVTFRWQVM